MTKRIILVFEMLFWPILGLSSLGIFTVFTKVPFSVKAFLFTGMIGWSIIHFSQVSISRGFLSELWHHTIKLTFSSPIRFSDFIIGHWLYGTLGATIGFTAMSFIALIFFNFNLFTISFYLLPIILLATLSGFVIGTIVVIFILMFGYRVDFLAWSIVDMIVFISGVYYSVTVFPKPLQIVSYSFPVIYVLESMREALFGFNPIQTFIKGCLVAFFWVLLSSFFIEKIDNYARKTGFYQRYG